MSSSEISNAVVRGKEGSNIDIINLATHYGIVEKDRVKQISFLTMAASNNSAEAAYSLGHLYSYDPNILDLEKCRYWYAFSARLGYEQARSKLLELENNDKTNSL